MSRSIRTRTLAAALSLFAVVAAARSAAAQAPVGAGYSSGAAYGASYASPGAPAPSFGLPTGGPPCGQAPATDLELATLYTFSAAYGVGTGVWLDAELGVGDPGLQFIFPGVLGVAAPVGVYVLDHPKMPRGMPSAMAAGMAIGAGEAIGVTSYQFVRSDADAAWGFRGFARATFLGSTAGVVAGYAAAVTMEPSPKTSLLLSSSVVWGSVVGGMFGYGASESGSDYGAANDRAALGGLVGYNVFLAGAGALSTQWVPTYKQLEYMWMGFGVGLGASTPVYLFYAGGDHDSRRGLIFQGTAGALGLLAGAVFTMDDKDEYASEPPNVASSRFAQVVAFAPMPVPGGAGVQVTGLLF